MGLKKDIDTNHWVWLDGREDPVHNISANTNNENNEKILCSVLGKDAQGIEAESCNKRHLFLCSEGRYEYVNG